MGNVITAQTFRSENRLFGDTGGISPNNGSQGFQPGLYDAESGQMAISCFADGRPALTRFILLVPVLNRTDPVKACG
jgi:hypothetical protein